MAVAKLNKCKECGSGFVQTRFAQIVCSPICGINHSRKLNEKKIVAARKADTKERKEKIKTHKDWINDLQPIFNQFIRLRDQDKDCISCGPKKQNVTFDAGHYRSVGAHPELRFNEYNVHKQCRKCNGYWGGNLIEYRKGLIQKIGVEKVEWLEGPHEPTKLSVEEIKELIIVYRNKIKTLKHGSN